MLHIVKSPGSCGELLQGSIDGQDFLVTCPINLYSYAISGDNLKIRLDAVKGIIEPHLPEELWRYLDAEVTESNVNINTNTNIITDTLSLQSKSLHAVELAGITGNDVNNIIGLSQLLQGKGLASSSADISAVAMAASLLKGKTLSYEELAKLCLAIEPSDASFYPGSVQFDYYKGKVTRYLGELPSMKLVIFDEGGTVDTVAFNSRIDLKEKVAAKEDVIREAFELLLAGFERGDSSLIGRAATMSALANQSILYKKHVPTLVEIGKETGSLGLVVAHSGTVMALLYPVDQMTDEIVPHVLQRCADLSYLYTVNTINTGITYVTIKE
ncbi:GHMP kinase [Veillonella sp.]|uniref:GHMP family kinase ATP-binding protein n=1 Tax=Veillonella sp. TaxID=1926307 RepID=UPI0025D7C913|nr:GHMP kinase [Veillonella sp.]